MLIEDRSSVAELRAAYQVRADCKFVDLQEFSDLLVSRRPMCRFQDGSAGLVGVRDVESGELFVIEEDRLPRF